MKITLTRIAIALSAALVMSGTVNNPATAEKPMKSKQLTMLKVGDRAPEWKLPATSGGDLSLSELLKNKAVVLYFYPKDGTPGCTKEACSFRDNFKSIQDLNAEVVGISADSIDSHNKFRSSNSLPFILVTDSTGDVRRAYGVPTMLGKWPARVTFIIDRQGIVRHVFNSLMCEEMHVTEAIKTLKSINQKTSS